MDTKTIKKLKKTAKRDNVSLSKWVTQKINNQMDSQWPEDFFKLFGSIKDKSFLRPKSLNFTKDLKREEL
jgi:hypothetical protein